MVLFGRWPARAEAGAVLSSWQMDGRPHPATISTSVFLWQKIPATMSSRETAMKMGCSKAVQERGREGMAGGGRGAVEARGTDGGGREAGGREAEG